MRRLFVLLLSAFMILALAACGSSEATKASSGTSEKSLEGQAIAKENVTQTTGQEKHILVAYFSCTGTTKALAQNVADILNADIYEIVPEIPYTANDLNYNDESSRSTVEQKNDAARPALKDGNANIEHYDTIVLAYPIWWGQAPRIIDTFMEHYDFSGKTIVPVCTSGGSDIGSSANYLHGLCAASAKWKDGKRFGNDNQSELKNWLNSLGL